jgi:hypothetical protein
VHQTGHKCLLRLPELGSQLIVFADPAVQFTGRTGRFSRYLTRKCGCSSACCCALLIRAIVIENPLTAVKVADLVVGEAFRKRTRSELGNSQLPGTVIPTSRPQRKCYVALGAYLLTSIHVRIRKCDFLACATTNPLASWQVGNHHESWCEHQCPLQHGKLHCGWVLPAHLSTDPSRPLPVHVY